ncbi:unnamed protein product [Rotaria sp. Silwood2]|nr:unnamed protein product [Rotaria sp. Silwood2]CAF2530037.1 unnamed protein product [Rotaria sp. Silwood2]CAF2764927.1 unnamed protein product [Rotaria sp. Silwood2]CAF2942062.1 unnamed protein product [Rotaria sp. Silwood2]CAF3910190.1 unnamed protein product [Rotaria sp. Silwood2]
MPEKKFWDGNALNSPPKIIIKKENIGLKEYQHQKYQYNLFTHIIKRDQYYEDLSRVKDRMGKTVPSMQQVIHGDMKRINTNKVYERKLNRDLTGPRGLNWQCKQKLQRLENNERDIERDLIRLNRDLARIALSTSVGQSPVSNEDNDPLQVQTEPLSSTTSINSMVQTSPKTKLILGRSISMNTSKTTTGHLTPLHQKRLSLNQTSSCNERSPWIDKQTFSKVNEERPYLQQHGLIIDREKRKIQQKLKCFFN